MASQILRVRGELLIQGPWGQRKYGPKNRDSLYRQVLQELIDSGVVPADSPVPSNRHHDHVTRSVMLGSWIEDGWVLDEPFADRLKKLREQAKLTQEQLAEKSGRTCVAPTDLESAIRPSPGVSEKPLTYLHR